MRDFDDTFLSINQLLGEQTHLTLPSSTIRLHNPRVLKLFSALFCVSLVVNYELAKIKKCFGFLVSFAFKAILVSKS